MSDEYKQSPRIENVQGNATFNIYETPPPPPSKPFRFGRWLYGLAAAIALGGGTFVTTQLNARPVYYCASHNTVKYHTNATCAHLKACGAVVRSMPVAQARDRMQLCKACH